MAAPTPQEVALDASCFDCISEKQLQAMIAYMLGQILLQSTPMANVTPEAIAAQSSCFLCLSGKQLISAQVYLLTQIFNNGGGGGGAGTLQVFQGSGAPSGIQTGMDGTKSALYYNTDPGGFLYYWHIAGQSWY